MISEYKKEKKMNNIRCIKLITGEEVIADISFNKTDKIYSLRNPFQIIIVPGRSSNDTQFGVIPFPLMIKDKNEVLKISLDHVIYEYEPADDFVSHYYTSTSGIVTPKTSLLM